MKIFLFQLAILAIFQVTSINSAVVTCKSITPPCVISSITPVTSASETITIASQPSNYVDQTTTNLDFNYNSSTNFIPSDIFRSFSRLNYVTFSNASVYHVVSNAFKNCGNLVTISMSDNNFPTLADDFASTCINVTSVQLYRNKIKELEENSLRGLTFLQYFNAPNNNISCIPSGLFKNTPIISTIDLSFNQIAEIAPDVFKGLAALSTIYFGYNKIKNLPAFDFTNTGMTMSINFQLNDNPIIAVNPQFITQLFATRISSMSSSNVMFYNNQNVTSCFPSNFYSSVSNYNWPTVNISLPLCYNNWKNEYQTTPVSCASDVEIETTTKASLGGNGNNFIGRWPFGDKFFAILTNNFQNFKADVSFD